MGAAGCRHAQLVRPGPLGSASAGRGGERFWGNVGPASQLGSGAIADRYPLSHYQLDQHFETISASLSGVDASGVAPTIAYFLAAVLWALTSFLAIILSRSSASPSASIP